MLAALGRDDEAPGQAGSGEEVGAKRSQVGSTNSRRRVMGGPREWTGALKGPRVDIDDNDYKSRKSVGIGS